MASDGPRCSELVSKSVSKGGEVDAMPWWDASGAFALYGVIAGGGITAGVAELGNRRAERVGAADRASRADQAALDREHEFEVSRRERINTARDRVYPAMALSAQSMAVAL